MATIYVIGHKNPDTDATVAPIVAAWYLGLKDKKNSYVPVIYNQPNKEAKFVLKHFSFNLPDEKQSFNPGDKVVIVDTTNPDELPDLADVEVIAVFDHHKLGGLKTTKPLSAFIFPLGSTTAVLFKYFKANRLGCKNLDPKIAGLMAAGIISDTLNLQSPTTTDFDKQALKKLIEIAEIKDVDKLASEMFDAKSSLEGLTPLDILKYDAKEYTFGAKKTLVAVFETVKPEKLFDIYEKLLEAVNKLKTDEGYDAVFFFVIDILKQTGFYMKVDAFEDKAIEQGYGVEIPNDAMFIELTGVVSRKKQIVPVLEKHVK